ncbi:MAG: TIGR03905 family TSCPD domain-containing protein [Marinilabiliaceae bacterium]
MVYEYRPEGVCSKLFQIEVDEAGIVRKAQVIGGCHGNLQGICRLIEGRPASEVAATLRGIRCGMKPTSCPDQISKALDQITARAGK